MGTIAKVDRGGSQGRAGVARSVSASGFLANLHGSRSWFGAMEIDDKPSADIHKEQGAGSGESADSRAEGESPRDNHDRRRTCKGCRSKEGIQRCLECGQWMCENCRGVNGAKCRNCETQFFGDRETETSGEKGEGRDAIVEKVVGSVKLIDAGDSVGNIDGKCEQVVGSVKLSDREHAMEQTDADTDVGEPAATVRQSKSGGVADALQDLSEEAK